MKAVNPRPLGLTAAIALFIALSFGEASASAPKPRKGVAFDAPALSVSGLPDSGAWGKSFPAVYATLIKNLHGPNRFFKTRFAYPSPVFRGVYLWDSAFIAQVWKPWDAATANEIAEAVWGNAAEDGRLKHYVSAYAKSDYTQPPVMTWSVGDNYSWSGDRAYLARAYPALKKYNEWLYANRRLDNGLFFWLHSYESGIDNSPRFGSADEKVKADMTRLAAVDLGSFIVRQNEVLAEMAAALGETADAAKFRAQAAELKDKINQLLWDEATGYYYDLDLNTNQLLKIKTIASLFPLFAGVPDAARARRVRDHVMNPAEFNTPMPLPSVARDDPAFDKDCWRGPIWINTAYVAILGMERYGYADEAAELSFRLVDGVYRNYALTHKFVEFYDPDHDGFGDLHRKRGNLYKLITLGDKPQPNFIGWTGLANTIVIEHLIGYHQTPQRRWLAPRFPKSAAGAVFHLTIPSSALDLAFTVRPDGGAQGAVTVQGKKTDFDLAPGQELKL
jgi:hypothetical protein